MYPEQLEINEEEIKELTALQHECHWRSNFNFFQTHNGIRKNKMHLLIAPTGSGKSTFVRSILCDALFRNSDKKILLILTEETKKEFKTEFASAVPSHDVLKNLRLMSELDTSFEDEEIKKTIEDSIEFYGIDLIVIDNITTSRFYMDKKTSEQAKIAMWYKDLAKKTSLLLIAHSNGNEFNNRLIDETDIRGSKTITNIAEFLYILQPIRIGDRLLQFLNVIKHRGQNLRKGKFFQLRYSEEMKSFDQDRRVTFDEMKEFFKERNQLGGR